MLWTGISFKDKIKCLILLPHVLSGLYDPSRPSDRSGWIIYLTQTIWCFINQHFKTDFWQKASVKLWDLDWSTHTSQQLLQTPRLAFVHLLPLFNSFLSSEPEGISRLIELSRCCRPILHVLLEIKVRASPVGWRPELDRTSQQNPDLEPKFDKTLWTWSQRALTAATASYHI